MEILESHCDTCGTVFETRKRPAKRIKTMQVYQWAYKNFYDEHWKMARRLLNEKDAHNIFDDCELVKIAGPFEVPI